MRPACLLDEPQRVATIASMHVREPAVAGTFYPAEPAILRETVQHLLDQSREKARGEGTMGDAATRPEDPAGKGPPGASAAEAIRAVIVPHAGYVYSGAVAARAYAQLAPLRGRVRRVVLIGPAHHVPIRGLALPGVDAMRTPLGLVSVDRVAAKRLRALPQVIELEEAHRLEHSLEVQLPFLQVVLGDFEVVPLVVGDATDAEVSAVFDRFWSDPDTLYVVSSDLSHYLDHASARRLDTVTCRAIEACDPTALDWESACGRVPIRGLLHAARAREARVRTLDLCTSGDTAGPRDRVVGYGAWLFLAPDRAERDRAPGDPRESSEAPLAADAALLALARSAIDRGLRTGTPPSLSPTDLARLPTPLQTPGAAFVTLWGPDGALRGCIGSLEPRRSLAEDVAANAWAAATEDPRFQPVTAEELETLSLQLSILGEPEPLAVSSRGELVSKLVPARDGLILEEGSRRATFLPQVWETVSNAEEFVGLLWRKIGLPADHWSPDVRAWRYATRSITEP